MYIKEVSIKNIRSISNYKMEFPSPPGWHVLIGDNGAGKSTVVRAIALALLGGNNVAATRENWDEWLKKEQQKGEILIKIEADESDDVDVSIKGGAFSSDFDASFDTGTDIKRNTKVKKGNWIIRNEVQFLRTALKVELILNAGTNNENPNFHNWSNGKGWFSVAYGPFRRFTGGNAEKEKIYLSNPKLGAHLSVFGEDVALSEAIPFIRDLYIKQLEKKPEGNYLNSLIKFINNNELLPHNSKIEKVDSDYVYFKDGNGQIVPAIQMSDGFRSILSLTFELIRQLIRVYGAEKVFVNSEKEKFIIDLPGVVLVDEIDAHLHPTWQTQIGQWFTKYFPKLQFIITTHSPLVCRAAEKGSIWRLAAPGSGYESGEITGQEKEKLIFGNILDAYGTEVFGQNVDRSLQSKEKLDRLAQLNTKLTFGKELSDEEATELKSLQKILTTDDTTQF